MEFWCNSIFRTCSYLRLGGVSTFTVNLFDEMEDGLVMYEEESLSGTANL